MPRTHLIRTISHPYYITCRCNNKESFPLPLEQVWEIMLTELKYVKFQFDLHIHAFLLMGNHFHLLCQTPTGNIDKVMQCFLKKTSQRMNKRVGTTSHLWGSRYKWSLLKNDRYHLHVYRYIFQNPIRAGICKRVEEYPFSTLTVRAQGELDWLNDIYETEIEQLIKLGLKKSEFSVRARKLKKIENLPLPENNLIDNFTFENHGV